MRSAFVIGCWLLVARLCAAPCTITLEASDHIGQSAVLYRYADLFSMRREVLAVGEVDGTGSVTLTGEVAEIVKGQIRVGMDVAELFLKPGAQYTIRLLPPDPAAGRSMSGAHLRPIEFLELEGLDINALTSDLNGHLDMFLIEDLATDQEAGMQALDLMRKEGSVKPDSAQRPATLFITPDLSDAKVDSFEQKLRKYYDGVNDPWFEAYMANAVAGLRFGPNANDSVLFARTLKDKPVRYNDPEYVRFFLSFFEDHLMSKVFPRSANALVSVVNNASADSLHLLLRKSEYLHDDRLRELVMLSELHGNYHGKTFQRAGIKQLLERTARSSVFSEHRTIATNLLWDLTSMANGDTLPSIMAWTSTSEKTELDTLLTEGPIYLAITASWCTYCELEMSAMEKLHAEYGKVVRFITLDIDGTTTSLEAQKRLHPQRTWMHLLAANDPLLMDKLRLRTVPAFFLLDGRTLKHSPAKAPSAGIAAEFHRIVTTQPQEGGRRVWDE